MIKPLAISLGHLFRLKNLPPVYLILGATWRCNARCITCFNRDRLNDPDVRELSVEEHLRVAQSMGPLIWLLFTGGEPILRDDLAEVAFAYYRYCGVRRITVPTNGLLPDKTIEITKAMLSRCADARITVSLALDGTAQAHDEIREKPGAFDTLLETYDSLAKLKGQNRRLSLNLNTVLTNRNIAVMPELMEMVLSRMPAMDFHGFELLRGRGTDPDLKPPSADEYERLLKLLIPYWSKFPFYRGPFRRWIRAAKIEARMLELDVLRGEKFRCGAGITTAYISPEGKVYFCEEPGDPVGDLRAVQYDFRKIWFSEDAERLRKTIAERSCSCTHSCFVGSSVLFDIIHYPSIIRRIL